MTRCVAVCQASDTTPAGSCPAACPVVQSTWPTAQRRLRLSALRCRRPVTCQETHVRHPSCQGDQLCCSQVWAQQTAEEATDSTAGPETCKQWRTAHLLDLQRLPGVAQVEHAGEGTKGGHPGVGARQAGQVLRDAHAALERRQASRLSVSWGRCRAADKCSTGCSAGYSG